MEFEREEYWVLLGGWRIGYALSGFVWCYVICFSVVMVMHFEYLMSLRVVIDFEQGGLRYMPWISVWMGHTLQQNYVEV